jgi:hypothetical protein
MEGGQNWTEMMAAGVRSPLPAYDLGKWFAAKELALRASGDFELCGHIASPGQ